MEGKTNGALDASEAYVPVPVPMFVYLLTGKIVSFADVTSLRFDNQFLFLLEHPGWPHSQNGPCFAAVGSGATHARAEFVHNSYDPSWSPARALMLVYGAKRRAEVDPYVGHETDLFSMGPLQQPYGPIDPEISTELQKIYDEAERQDSFQRSKRFVDFENYVADVFKKRRGEYESQSDELREPAEEHQVDLVDK